MREREEKGKEMGVKSKGRFATLVSGDKLA